MKTKNELRAVLRQLLPKLSEAILVVDKQHNEADCKKDEPLRAQAYQLLRALHVVSFELSHFPSYSELHRSGHNED